MKPLKKYSRLEFYFFLYIKCNFLANCLQLHALQISITNFREIYFEQQNYKLLSKSVKSLIPSERNLQYYRVSINRPHDARFTSLLPFFRILLTTTPLFIKCYHAITQNILSILYSIIYVLIPYFSRLIGCHI